MPIGTTSVTKFVLAPLVVVAAAALVEVDLAAGNYASDGIAVLFALCGGMATQLDAISRLKVNKALICSELMFSALAGFIVHALLLNMIEEPRIIWGTAAAIGAVGSQFVRMFGRKHLSQYKMFQTDDDDDE